MVKLKSRRAYRASPARKSNRRLLTSAGLIAAVLVIVAVLELTNTTHIFHKTKVPAVIPSTSSDSGLKATSQGSNSGSASASQSTPASSKTPSLAGGGTDTNLPLAPPYGAFVSNHHPDSSTSLDEVSVCNTTPGATCYIKFTDGTTSTQLPSQIVGADGSTSWNWNVATDAHLSSGQWQITAVATLNGQTKSTDDTLKLVVQ